MRAGVMPKAVMVTPRRNIYAKNYRRERYSARTSHSSSPILGIAGAHSRRGGWCDSVEAGRVSTATGRGLRHQRPLGRVQEAVTGETKMEACKSRRKRKAKKERK